MDHSVQIHHTNLSDTSITIYTNLNPLKTLFNRKVLPMLCLHHESMLYGAGERVRTVDLNLGKVALYQLSYARFY